MTTVKNKLTVPDVMPLVRAFQSKPENGVGGNLHIVLDDGNVSDDDVRFCLELAKKAGDLDGVELAEKLLLLTKTQRLKISSKFYEEEPRPSFKP